MNEYKYDIYEGTAPYLFISYSHKDTPLVQPLIHGLQGMGYRLWYDTGITVGGRWPDIIAEHVMKSSCVVAFLSRNAMESDYCQEEIFFALEEHRPIVPVYLENIILPPGLRMRLNIRQAIYRNRYHSDNEFLRKLTSEGYVKPSYSGKSITDELPHPAPTADDIDLLYTGEEPYRNQWTKTAPLIEYHDHLLISAVDIIMESGIVSISLIQRRLKIGFARTAQLIDEIEALGIISPFNRQKMLRTILIAPKQWEDMKKSMKLAT